MLKTYLTVPSLIALLLFAELSSAQSTYWQQQVNYKINVALNDQQHSLSGTEEIEYINNSPDQLNFIWFHLWPNAYKNETTAFAKQLLRADDGKKRWKNIKDKGYIDSLNFYVDGQKAATEPHPEHPDILKILLPKSLPAGGKIKISTPFFVRLPTYNSRSGHDGNSYITCQWYPKPAVYDKRGWHEMPYLDQGEFYSDFGNFDVAITLPSKYIVAATGQLQDENELDQYKLIGKQNVAAGSRRNETAYKAAGIEKTLHYSAKNVIDFAWFADKDFVIRYDTIMLNSGNTVDVFSYHHPKGAANWVKSTDFIKSGARAYSSYFGEYAYPVVQAVEGPSNEMSGGMEYPMITLITTPNAKDETLDAVITHEVGHNWLCMMLASNERDHAWMDEGINTYLQFRYEAEKYRSNAVFGDQLPDYLRKQKPDDFQALVYQALSKIPMEDPIDQTASKYKNKDQYGLIVYVKTAVWMYLLELELTKAKVDKALRNYFETWKFKHPYPEDFRAVLEKEMNADLTTYFELLNKSGNL